DIRGAHLELGPGNGTGITLAQLYSTASYQNHDLSGVDLEGENLSGANFASQNLSRADFGGATLTGADFSHANLAGAGFNNNLHLANFSQANLDGATFDYGASFSAVSFSGATISNATFRGNAPAIAQIYSTASYQSHDLHGLALIGLYEPAAFEGINL